MCALVNQEDTIKEYVKMWMADSNDNLGMVQMVHNNYPFSNIPQNIQLPFDVTER